MGCLELFLVGVVIGLIYQIISWWINNRELNFDEGTSSNVYINNYNINNFVNLDLASKNRICGYCGTHNEISNLNCRSCGAPNG